MLKKIIFASLVSVLFLGCLNKQTTIVQTKIKYETVYLSANKLNKKDPKDLEVYPQNAQNYTKNIKNLTKRQKDKLYKEFFALYFRPWNISKMTMSKKNAFWGNN